MLTLEIVQISDIDKIKDCWSLLSDGADMTYFQSFDWNEMMCRFVPQHKHVDSKLYLIRRDGMPVLLAPLWIIKRNFGANKKGVYFIGRNSYSDYLSLIYDKFDPDAFDFLVKKVSEEYGSIVWHFEQLKEGTQLYDYLTRGGHDTCTILSDSPCSCACLTLPGSYDEYLASLSKNTRQNIRTARNRLASDGITLDINIDNKDIDAQVCLDLRSRRLSQKRISGIKRMSLRDLIQIIRYKITQKNQISFPSVVPFVEDKNSHMVTATDRANGELAAFFCYGINTANHELVVMTAATNHEYAKYSPGMLCMVELIDDLISKGLVSKVDFTRGGEVYKYRLGAVTHTIHDLTVNFNLQLHR